MSLCIECVDRGDCRPLNDRPRQNSCRNKRSIIEKRRVEAALGKPQAPELSTVSPARECIIAAKYAAKYSRPLGPAPNQTFLEAPRHDPLILPCLLK